MGFEWVGFHMKGALAGESFTVSRNWLAVGDSLSRGCKA